MNQTSLATSQGVSAPQGGIAPAAVQRAETLHRTSIIVDGTCPGDHWSENFDQWITGGATCCVVTVASTESARETMKSIGGFYKLLRENSDRLVLATTTSEIRQAKTDGKLAVVMQFQGTHPIEYDYNLVELYGRLGVRIVQLTYNQRSAVGDGCEEPGNAGLSEFGHKVVEELNRLGIAVDLAHTGVQTSLDAIEASASPCIVSHSNCSSVHTSKRNLSDELIRAVTGNGGVIGLNGFPAFVRDAEAPTLDDLIDHMVHIDSLAGPGHVGLGLDYYQCGIVQYEQFISDGLWHPGNYPPPPWNFPAGIEDPSTLHRLTDRLVERGYTDEEIKGVLGENWMRIFDKIWSKA
ncbi:dipeptidase [Arthrobacter sp. alpha11c]